jgi:hypothetical protein
MAKERKYFTILVEAEAFLAIDEIWPDSDAPE